MNNRARDLAVIVSFGIIMANLAVSSSSVFRDFAPFPVNTTWFNLAALICGLVIGIFLDDSALSLSGVAVIAVIAVSVFSAVLILVAVLANQPFLDLIVLYAFQQALPHFIFVCVLGYAGLFSSYILKLFLGGR